MLAGGKKPSAGPHALAIDAAALTAEYEPLALAVEPQALAWAQPTVRFLQTGELPEEQGKAEKVARRSSMYQFVDDALYKRRPKA